MSMRSIDFEHFYENFQSPISTINCGNKCAPYNHQHAPFCCDTRHIVPSAYVEEWDFLRCGTNLWHLWESGDDKKKKSVQNELPHGQVLIECLGHAHCQREYRSISCRSFPFFPYISHSAKFIGISFYWEYADLCWIISNLDCVTIDFLAEFFHTYELIFKLMPEEFQVYQDFSEYMRDTFAHKKRKALIICRDDSHRVQFYKINPIDESMKPVSAHSLPKYGVYKISDRLSFSDETR